MSLHQLCAAALLLTAMLQIAAAARPGDISNNGNLLKMYYNGSWTQLCADWFTSKDAAIACRELGNSTYNVGVTVHSLTEARPLVRNKLVKCVGNENRLGDCYWPTTGTCHSGLATVKCYSESDVILKKLTISLTNISGYVNTTKSVFCGINSERNIPSLWYKWTINGIGLSAMQTMTLNLTKERNKQTLTCHLNYQDEEVDNKTIPIEVYYPPTRYRRLNFTREAGSDVILPAEDLGNPESTCTWLRLSPKKEESFREECCLNNVSKSSSGMFLVEMENTMNVNLGGKQTGVGVLLVTLNVLDKPKCTAERYIGKGDELKLPCLQTYDWSIFQVNWTSANGTNLSEETNYTIPSSEPGEKTYHCFAEYNVSGVGIKKQSCDIKVIIADNKTTEEVDVNSSVTSDTINIPDVNTYEWTKVGNFGTEETKFPNLTNISKSDSGLYFGRRKKKGTLLVQLDVKYMPEISCQQSRILTAGVDYDLQCKVDAFPRPSRMEWTNQGCANPSNGSDVMTCALRDVSFGDAGVYNCTASNEKGEAFCLISLQVFESPFAASPAIAVVSGVLSALILVMLIVIAVFAKKLFCSDIGRKSKDSGISLPVMPRPISLGPSPSLLEPQPNVSGPPPKLPPLPKPPGQNDQEGQELYENA